MISIKTRQCFVSNSSSSSFIIAINKNKRKKCHHCGRIDFDLIKLVENTFDDDTDVRIEPVEFDEFITRLKCDDYYNDVDHVINRVGDFARTNPEFNKFSDIKLSINNDMFNKVMHQLVDSGSIKIVYGDE